MGGWKGARRPIEGRITPNLKAGAGGEGESRTNGPQKRRGAAVGRAGWNCVTGHWSSVNLGLGGHEEARLEMEEAALGECASRDVVAIASVRREQQKFIL